MRKMQFFFIVFLFFLIFLVIFPVELFFWWFGVWLCFFVFSCFSIFFAKINFLCSTRGHHFGYYKRQKALRTHLEGATSGCSAFPRSPLPEVAIYSWRLGSCCDRFGTRNDSIIYDHYLELCWILKSFGCYFGHTEDIIFRQKSGKSTEKPHDWTLRTCGLAKPLRVGSRTGEQQINTVWIILDQILGSHYITLKISTWDHWNVPWLILALGLVTSEHNRLRFAVLLGCFIIPGLRDFTSFNNREPKQVYFASSAPDACQVHLQNLVLASVVLSLLVIASILPSVPIQWVKGQGSPKNGSQF